MRLKRLLACIFAINVVLTAVFSCSEKETTLSVSQTSLFFSDATVVKTIDLQCNGSWTAQVPEWLACEPSSGKGDSKVTVRISDDSGFSHNGSIIFTADDKMSTVTVKLSGEDFVISSDSFQFDEKGTPIKATIKSNFAWNISIPQEASWIEIEPLSGQPGETEVTMTPKPIEDRKARSSQIIDVSYGTKFAMFVISQVMPNTAPQAPALISPVGGSTARIDTEFKWEKAYDADGDILTYELQVTPDDGKTWLTTTVEDATSAKLPELLSILSEYKWKVSVSDPFGGTSESSLASFSTSSEGAWKDQEVRIIQEATANAPKPVNLLILGDGYTTSDFIDGAKFDQDLKRAYESFFSIEPYKTYKNYFKVTAMAAYSMESGATVKKNIPEYPNDMAGGCPKQTKNTIFNTTFEGGGSTGITCDYDRVMAYAKMIEGIDDAELTRSAILLMVNFDVYAGTCVSFKSGQSIAMCPVGKQTFETIVNHECGGHGFGRVLDEYVYYSDQTIPNTDSGLQQISEWRKTDPYYAYNIDLTGSREEVHWKHFFQEEGYSSVGLFEGSMMYGKGVWRSERISCMCDNRKYYNAPTREAIVHRIMESSGSQFDFKAFVANDKVKSDDTGVALPPEYSGTRSTSGVYLPPLAPPILIDK